MAKLVILGSSNAIPDEQHENTHMAVLGQDYSLLIDCVSNPVVRLPKAGIDLNRLTDMVLTHFHPDHVSGVPLLLMNMWLQGRKSLLNIYGLHHTIHRVENLMVLYEWESWPNFFPVIFHPLPEEEMAPVLSNPEFRVFSSPVRHLVPTIGLRIEFPQTGMSLAYSCDTEPCPEVINLAAGADVLIHEAAGPGTGHSTASQAGGVAREAEVGSLYLIHYRTGNFNPCSLVEEAEKVYPGKVLLAKDFMEIPF